MPLIGLEDFTFLLRRSGPYQLQQAVDLPELGHAHVHVVVEDGLEPFLGFGVFAHVSQNGRHLNDRRHLVGGDVPAGLPPMEGIVQHAEVIGHEASAPDPHVHSIWVDRHDFLHGRERLSGLGHRWRNPSGR